MYQTGDELLPCSDHPVICRIYRQTSNILRTKFQNFIVSRLVFAQSIEARF